jgi:hypothetical protein
MNKIFSNKKGTALLMTVLILNSILIVSLAIAQIVFSGVKMGNKEALSTKAYFAAETGAERVLWEFRKGACVGNAEACWFWGSLIFGYSDPTYSPGYSVGHRTGSNAIFFSTGVFHDQFRTVELDLNF